jgi:hypothetical protein
MKQYISIDAGEPIKTAIDLLLDSQSKTFFDYSERTSRNFKSRPNYSRSFRKGENVVIRSAMNKNLIYLDVETLLENIFELVYKTKLI